MTNKFLECVVNKNIKTTKSTSRKRTALINKKPPAFAGGLY